MNLSLARGFLYVCVLVAAPVYRASGQAQTPPAPAQPPAAQAPSLSQAPPAQTPPPPAPTVAQAPNQDNSGEGAFSFQAFYWLTKGHPDMFAGKTHVATTPGDLSFPGDAKYSPGVVVSFPAGSDNSVRVSYFRTQGTGNTVASKELNIFSTDFTTGDYLATRYTLQNVKVSLDFLSYPTPPTSKFRLKTLWEVQYLTLYSSVDGPLKPILVDSSGNLIPNTGEGTRYFFLPSFGAALEHTTTKNFRWEIRFSGFGIPHRAALWDGQAYIAYRIDRFELTAGYKGFYFKTSPKNDQYFKGTLSGAYVGLTWYPRF